MNAARRKSLYSEATASTTLTDTAVTDMTANDMTVTDTTATAGASAQSQEPSRFYTLMKGFFAEAFKERDRKRRRDRDKYYGF